MARPQTIQCGFCYCTPTGQECKDIKPRVVKNMPKKVYNSELNSRKENNKMKHLFEWKCLKYLTQNRIQKKCKDSPPPIIRKHHTSGQTSLVMFTKSKRIETF